MSRFARRQDANHSEIVGAYQKLGVCVLDLSKVAELTMPGCPDLLCALHGYIWLSETKTDIGELNPAQLRFIDFWKGPVRIVRTCSDVFAIVNEVKAMTGAGRWVKKP